MDVKHTRRILQATRRDTRVLIHKFRLSLLAFAVLLIDGSVALRIWYVHPETGARLRWIESLHNGPFAFELGRFPSL